MRFTVGAAVLLATTFIRHAAALGATDEYRDADVEQTSYL